MQINSAKIEGMTLKLELSDYASRQKAGRVVSGFKPGDYEIKPVKKRRSLDANGYTWTLIDKIAEATGRTKEEVYCEELRNIGGVSDTVCVMEKASRRLKAGWESKGLGWQCLTETSKIPDCVNCTLIYGSSVFDSSQMARLIDQLIQDADALGIETITPKEKAKLLAAWEK